MAQGKLLFFGDKAEGKIASIMDLSSGSSVGSIKLISQKISEVTGILLDIITTIGVLAIIVAGFLYILSVKQEEYRERANKIMIYTTVAIAIASIAHGVTVFVINAPDKIKSGVGKITLDTPSEASVIADRFANLFQKAKEENKCTSENAAVCNEIEALQKELKSR